MDKVDAFLKEIVEVCRKHKMSLAHEDSQGGFIVQNYREDNILWLLAASDEASKLDEELMKEAE